METFRQTNTAQRDDCCLVTCKRWYFCHISAVASGVNWDAFHQQRYVCLFPYSHPLFLCIYAHRTIMMVCGQYSDREQICSSPQGILFSFMKPCTQVITQYYHERGEGCVFNNLLRKKNVSEVGGSSCQQIVDGNAQMQRAGAGVATVLQYQSNCLLQITNMS